MALVQPLLTAILLGGFCLAFACLGNQILRLLHWEMAHNGEHLLVAIALGVNATEILLFVVQITQHIRQGCWVIVALLCVVVIWERTSIWRRLKVLRQIIPSTTHDKSLLVLIAAVASAEFLVSQAPLTGSDAMHYHFTVQKLILQQGFHPIFSNSHSSLCGQHHLLILLGLALGSEQLALGLIFLGGILTAASLISLTSRMASPTIGAAFSLLFLLTPVVFWQITSSGAPDIFMAFMACTAVLVLRQKAQGEVWRQVFLAGFLTGGIAGAKYTGCLIAAAFAIAVVMECRSAVQVCRFVLASLLSGVWPYLRNLVWTGNPLFPFLAARLSPHLVTTYALTSLAADTGASSRHDPFHLIPFVFLAAAQTNNPGLWDFFGPLILALAPLMFLAFKNVRAWRIPIVVWILSGVSIFFASGLPRFLLPIFPIALSCVAAGFAAAIHRNWRAASRLITCLLIFLTVADAGGLAIYSQRPILAAIRPKSKHAYLEQRAQDYQIVEAVNRLLGTRHDQLRTLVFVRHLYYLDVSYLNGDPDTSFAVDPDRMLTKQEWRQFFEKNRIGYIVRSPDYPQAIAESLTRMEKDGDLVPFAEFEVQNFQGKRSDEKRQPIVVVILKVRIPEFD
jgi:hypothetical protein